MRIANSGNVGIGTTSPSAKLQVKGDGGVAGITFQTTDSSNNQTFYVLDGGRAGIQYYPFMIAHSSSVTPTGAPYLQVATSALYVSQSGNVGIGTSSPDDKLEVEGGGIGINNTSDPYLRFRESGTIVSDIFADTSANNLVVRGSSGHGVEILANGASEGAAHLVVSGSSGNVGIGTASPSAKLEIAGFSTGAGLKLNYGNSSGTIEAINFIANGGANGVIGMQMVSAGVGDLWLGGSGGRSLTLYRDGNVGIGVDVPNYKLEISGSTNVYGRLDVGTGLDFPAGTSNAIATFKQAGSVGGIILQEAGGTSNDRILKLNSNGDEQSIEATYRDTGPYGNLVFKTGGSNRMFISSSGNVGIGTDSPADKLTVKSPGEVGSYGDGFVFQRNATTAKLVRIYESSADGFLEVRTGGDSIVSKLSGYSGTPSYFLSNVGIGNTSPTTKLTIDNSPNPKTNHIDMVGYNGTAKGHVGQFSDTLYLTSNWYYDGGQYYDTVSLGQAAIVASAGATTTSFIDFLLSDAGASSPASKMRISANGNVGIGTTSPSAPLTVAGTADLAWAASTSKLQISRNSTVARLQNYENGSASTNLALQWEGGNVGIGTSSPGAKLDVNGEVVFSPNTAGKNTFTFTTNASNDARLLLKSNTTTTVDIQANGNSYFNGGNVGIGTTTPNAKLDLGTSINGNYRASFFMYNDNTAGIYHGTKNGFYMDQFGLSNNTLLSFSTAASAPGTFMLASKNTDISSSAALTPRMTILGESGNVGIGTTTPSTTLDVLGASLAVRGSQTRLSIGTNYPGSGDIPAGTLISVDDVTNNNLGIIPSSAGTVGSKVAGVAYNGSAWRSMYEYANVNTGEPNLILVKTTGNVGIGTTSPTRKLHILSTDDTRGIMVEQTLASSYAEVHFKANREYRVGTGGSTSAAEAANSWYVYDATAAAQRFVINSSGSVGIGTSSPTQRLHVSGAIAIEAESTTTKYSTTFSGTLSSNTNIAFIPTGSFKAAFFDYYVASSSTNMRAGTIMAVHNNSTSRYTDTSTGDIGNTSAVDFSTSVISGNLVLTANISSGTWEIKTAYRAL
jgi:hypothetical protein